MQSDSKLEMVKRHIRQAELHIAEQNKLIEELRRDGHSTLVAESLLKVFEETLQDHKATLAVLQATVP